jgi:mannosyl-oligosaccharide alpha-1,2-mannosidase
MYKDKPYNYPPSQRRGRRKLYLTLGVLLVIVWLYYTGWIGGSSGGSEARDREGKGLWGTFSSESPKGPVNWTQRREQVKKAMEISWAGYEKYAWGMPSAGDKMLVGFG